MNSFNGNSHTTLAQTAYALMLLATSFLLGAAQEESLQEDSNAKDIAIQTLSERFDDKIAPTTLDKYAEREALEILIIVEKKAGGWDQGYSTTEDIAAAMEGEELKGYLGRKGVAVSITAERLLQILNGYDNIVYVMPNRQFTPFLNDSVQIVDAINAWTVEINGQPLTGTGQTIAILDSGVDFTHPDLSSQNALESVTQLDCRDVVSLGFCFLDPTVLPTTPHGTRVAGCAVASGGVNGIAKGANIISVLVGGVSFSGAAIFNAIDWCTMNASTYNIKVINMSFGGEYHAVECDESPLSLGWNFFLEDAVANGIIPVAATGNSGSTTEIASPACLSYVIAVASSDKNDAFVAGSDHNEFVKVTAPGVSISTTTQGGGYATVGGTSFSAPMVSGAVAILQQALELRNRSATPQEIQALLFETGDPITGMDFNITRRLNVNSAVQYFVEPTCADVDGNGAVNVTDLLALLGAWGACTAIPDTCASDYNRDGTVNVTDLLRLLAEWGDCQ